MLMWMLTVVVAAASAQPLCRRYTVRTGKVFDNRQQAEGDLLFHAYPTVRLIKDECKKNVLLYLGSRVFMTLDNFETSLPPLLIPKSLQAGTASVTSAHFATKRVILFVVNFKVYLYNYEENSWSATSGIPEPVTHISGDCCCFDETFCIELSNDVFVYRRGAQLPGTTIYFSDNGGFSFQTVDKSKLADFHGELGGIFFLHSMSQVGILLVKDGKGTFYYTDHPLNSSMGIPFEYNEPLDVIVKPGQRGFLALWGPNTMLVSPNAGQILEPVKLQKGTTTVTSDVCTTNITIHSVASNTFELAFLTRENRLFYGSQAYLGTIVVELLEQPVWTDSTGIQFYSTGMLDIITPVADENSLAYDFLKCPVNVQAVFMDPKMQMEPCNVEVLESTLVNQMFTIDMNSKLALSALMIPRPGMTPVPMVFVSNPHALGLEAILLDFGYTFEGSAKYKLEIELQQQQSRGISEANFTSSIKRQAISSVTVDIAEKAVTCVDLKPLTTLISIGCDLTKKIIVQNKISACTMGILDAVELQRNYSYTVEREAYDPINHKGEAQHDLLVFYEYKDLGCPRLVYYDKPWRPVVELWKDGALEEIMNAEYVINEINGIVTYSYSLTAAAAGCRSQPQNWSTFEDDLDNEDQAHVWSRENYVSCHEEDKDNPLLWPDVEYQILGGRTDNRIIFGQRNGIYTFLLSVVDPYYSYCNLDAMFSVYVYGALPIAVFPPVLSITGLVVFLLLFLWLIYIIPKMLNTKRGKLLRAGCLRPCSLCSVACLWSCLRSCLQRCLRSRKVEVEEEPEEPGTAERAQQGEGGPRPDPAV